MGASDPLHDFQEERIDGGRFHVAIVVDNKDPYSPPLQRVKIRISEIHTGLEDEHLPWAMPCAPVVVGNTDGIGSVYVPVVGSKVYVFFQDNSPYFPVYIGYATSKDSQVEELLKEDYPHCYGYVDRSGNLKIVNTEKDTVYFCHVSGTSVHISKEGDLKVLVAKTCEIHCQDKVRIVSKAEVYIDSAPEVNISGGVINLNCDDPEDPDDVTPRERPEEKDPKGQTTY